MPESTERWAVFLGPSLPVGAARGIFDADYLPPIRRGDLPREVEAGRRRVAIIDGEFDQSLAVSIVEIRSAIRAGAQLWGASSMGALRGAECGPLGMRGVGWVFEQYERGIIEDDDEVALMFSARDGAAVTVPLVNIRWALRCAVAQGRLAEADAAEVLAAARSVPYHRRTLDALEIPHGDAAPKVEALLELWRAGGEGFDRKRADAIELLERLAASSDG